MLSIILSALFLAASGILYAATLTIPGGTQYDVIGSRLMPQIFIIGLAFCSLMVFVLGIAAELRKGATQRPSLLATAVAYRKVITVFLAILVWLSSVQLLGFYATAFVFLAFLHWFLNDCRFTPAVAIVPLVSLAAIFFVFEKGLKVIMPHGLLF